MPHSLLWGATSLQLSHGRTPKPLHLLTSIQPPPPADTMMTHSHVSISKWSCPCFQLRQATSTSWLTSSYPARPALWPALWPAPFQLKSWHSWILQQVWIGTTRNDSCLTGHYCNFSKIPKNMRIRRHEWVMDMSHGHVVGVRTCHRAGDAFVVITPMTLCLQYSHAYLKHDRKEVIGSWSWICCPLS